MSSPVADKIRTRGYWRVVIRPTTFQTRVNSFEKLTNTVEVAWLKAFASFASISCFLSLDIAI
mgnify:CR=1 FL=1